MTRTCRALALLALVIALPDALPAQANPVSIAILPFVDGGSYGQDRDVFAALEVAIPAMLQEQLRTSAGATMVDRATIEPLLPRSPDARRLDVSGAAQLGRQAGAGYVITGAFMDHYGRLRVDARVVDAQRSQIVTVVSNDPALKDRRELSAMIGSLATGLSRALKLASPAPPPMVPTDAIVSFGQGLLLEDAGNREGAAARYRDALARAHGFSAASAALARVGGS